MLLTANGWDTTAHPRLQDWLTFRLGKDYPALHAHDVFTGVMQRMGVERVVRVGGIDVAHIEPLAEPALDDVDVVHPTCPPFCDE